MIEERNNIDQQFIDELNNTTTKKKIRLPLPGKPSYQNVQGMRSKQTRDEGALGHAVANYNKKNNGLL